MIHAFYANQRENDIIDNKLFSLIPLKYQSFELALAEYESKQISLTDNQIKELVLVLRDYQAETTDEVAFADSYRNNAYFVLTFFNDQNSAFYSLGVCVGRNETEECYAVSNYSNLYYARIINASELYSRVCDLLVSWGFE